MDRDEMARQLEAQAGKLQHQVLNNLDDWVAERVAEGVKIDKDWLDRMVKRPVMQVVTKLKGLHLVTVNPGFERKKE